VGQLENQWVSWRSGTQLAQECQGRVQHVVLEGIVPFIHPNPPPAGLGMGLGHAQSQGLDLHPPTGHIWLVPMGYRVYQGWGTDLLA
jgi:glucose/arabinose dehydrogenase